MPKTRPTEVVKLEKIVGGGQALGTLQSGLKVFVWGGLPNEKVEIEITRKKSKFAEGRILQVIDPSDNRIEPVDKNTYLSTSPWQIMTFDSEQKYKLQLIDEAFALHHITLPNATQLYTNNHIIGYRNKVEFSWYGRLDENGNETLDLAFFKRGSKGKVIVDSCSLLPEPAMRLSARIRDELNSNRILARQLKTLLVRSNQKGDCVWQLYTKEKGEFINAKTAATLPAIGGEVIYSDPLSPASKITERLVSYGNVTLEDTILNIPFRYATESFFQVNIPVYEQALRDMQKWVPRNNKVLDMYSGVGSIGLTIGGNNCTLVEINENAVREMRRNITKLGSKATPILAASEKALEYIEDDAILIVDPPRAGLHPSIIQRILEVKPKRIVYLSCNPATQARDIELLHKRYNIQYHQGYNFFPRTPHIEHLVVLDV